MNWRAGPPLTALSFGKEGQSDMPTQRTGQPGGLPIIFGPIWAGVMVVNTVGRVPRRGGISNVQLSEPFRMEWQCVNPNGSRPFNSCHHRAASVQRLCVLLPVWLDAVEQECISCKPARVGSTTRGVTLSATSVRNLQIGP
jgi:hypothetical protein